MLKKFAAKLEPAYRKKVKRDGREEEERDMERHII